MYQEFNKKIAVIDLDGTLIEGQIQQALIRFFYSKGELSLLYLIRLNVWFFLYKVHMTNDVKKIFEFGLSYLKEEKIDRIGLLVDEFIKTRLRSKIFNRSFDLINNLKDEGYSIVILSTAIDAVVSKLSLIFGADDYLCTKLETVGDEYTGHILGDIVYGEKKTEKLKEYFSERSYILSDARGYADHESDIPMLKVVGQAYIVNPNAHMSRIAEREGIAIIDTR